ncbi:TPA: autotransporter outer membrane beta-barrel domain-containing protein [Yersinia enterocolitica]|nr:autotransporter outer membrane beta-barrel domain-containing protein [Yersinia enterocolitica]
MSHHKPLNTRLLPLSILISSLVSGGAVAASTTEFTPGATLGIANGGSFLVTDNIVVGAPEEKSIIDKLGDYLAAGFITKEQKEKWQENLEKLEKEKTAEKNAQAAVELATKAKEEASQHATELKEQKEAKEKEVTAKEKEIDNLTNDLATKNGGKKTTVEALSLNPGNADIATKVTDLLASSTKELVAKNTALADKIKEHEAATKAKTQHEEKIKKFNEQITELDRELTDANDNKINVLETAANTAKQAKSNAELDKDSELGKAKELHESTENNLASQNSAEKNTAIENQAAYNKLLKAFEDAITEAEQAVKDKETEIERLEQEKSVIKSEKSTADGQTTQIENAASDATNAKDTAENEIKTIQKTIVNATAADNAIKEAATAQAALTKAEDEQQKLTEYHNSIENELTAAEEVKTKAESDFSNKISTLDTAKKAVEDLVTNTSATELPAVNKTIDKTKSEDVAANTVAIDTKVAGGTQEVAKDGKIIGSIISEDGTVKLAVGAEARNTVVDQGTINNNGGTDHNSVINGGGKLILAGETTKDANGSDVVNIAKSHNAQINTGGIAEVEAHSEIHGLTSTGGAVALKDGAKAFDTTIDGGTFTIAKGANAQQTSLTNARLELIEGATADDTKLANHSTFTLLDGATTTGTLINSDSQFIVNDNATANNTTLNSGEFIVDGTAKDTTVTGGKFALNKGATANATILNSGEFIVDGIAKDTTVKGGKFNLMARAQAHKLVVDNGSALIAGNLMDAAFNGGTIIFDKAASIGGTVIFDKAANIGGTVILDKAANIGGTINANKDSIINLHEGAKTAKADLILAGKMELIAADIAQTTAKSAGRAAFAGSTGKPAQFAFKNVELAGGSIDMSKSNAQLTMASLAGKGNFKLGSALYNHATAPLNVTGDANGEFDIQIDASGVAPANLSIVDVKGANTARFALSNGPINLGNYQHNLVSDGKGGFKLVADKTALTPGAAGILAVANTTPTIFNAELSSIQNRLDKQSASANESGVWLTYLNDNYDVKGTATNFKQKLNGMTLGGDKAMELGEAVFSIGAFASHSSSNIKSDYQSSGSVESNSLGAYAQYLANSGYYLNGVLKTNQFKQNLNINAKDNNASSNANFSGLGLAVKAGKHITIDELYVSPFAAMSSFTSGKSQYQLSNGMEAQSQGARTTTGTIGMNTGYRFVLNSGAEIKPYAIFSVDHDLMAKNHVMINNELFDNSLKGTRANAGVGVNVNLTSNLSVGSEVKVSKGKNIATPMTINMGVAYTF